MRYLYPINPNYKDARHYQAQRGQNVACANGSAHITRTNAEEFVTCEKCRAIIDAKYTAESGIDMYDVYFGSARTNRKPLTLAEALEVKAIFEADNFTTTVSLIKI
jgi:hypothetical protein